MRKFDGDMDGGVQDAASSAELGATDFGDVSTRRYTVAADEPLDVAIVYAVSAMKGVDPTEFDRPLQDVVDADALRRLFESPSETLSATILVDDFRVTVADGGRELIISKR